MKDKKCPLSGKECNNIKEFHVTEIINNTKFKIMKLCENCIDSYYLNEKSSDEIETIFNNILNIIKNQDEQQVSYDLYKNNKSLEEYKIFLENKIKDYVKSEDYKEASNIKNKLEKLEEIISEKNSLEKEIENETKDQEKIDDLKEKLNKLIRDFFKKD